LPATFAKRAASLIPHARVVTLDTGHFIPLDKPKEVAACLRSFFAENQATMDLPIRVTNRSARSARSRTVLVEPLTFEGHRPVPVVS
jgi:hypothetical protein